MSRWFRFYARAMRTPKVMRLSDRDFRLWVNMLAIASENDGRLPGDDDLKMLLSMRLDHLKAALDRLIKGGLIDSLADGYEPHDWKEHQYKSDTSTERVKRHRAKRNVSETPPETETESDTEKICAKAHKRAPVFRCPDGVDSGHWKDFLANRTRKKFASTPTAYARVLSDIEKHQTADWPPGRLVQHAAEMGWGSIHLPTEDKRNGNRTGNDEPQSPILRAVLDEEARRDTGGGLGRS